jgi:hypothetical protein
MSSVKTRKQPEPVIETAPIKLSVEETRAIMRVSVAGKPIPGDYHFGALADMGILRRIEVTEEKDTSRKIAECWKRARMAFVLKDGEAVHQAMHDLEKLNSDRHREDTKYLVGLTDLGKQVARGIGVRLDGQYMRAHAGRR